MGHMQDGQWGGEIMTMAMTTKERAIDLYMRGIRDGQAQEALDMHIGDRYTQHSTGVADGKEGFLEFFLPFLQRNPVRDMQIKRALQDGRKVFVHCHQNLNNGEAEWVTMDFFHSDENGKIIEHWDVIAPFRASNPSGRSMVDGATEITDFEKTDMNRAIVRRLVEDGLIAKNVNVLREIISEETYIQHNPDVSDGREHFLQLFEVENSPLEYHDLVHIVAEGNFVAVMCRTTWEGDDCCQADLFRLEDGKIVEHWDTAEMVGPKETWNNSGKF